MINIWNRYKPRTTGLSKGFTLVEVLLAVVFLGLLAGAAATVSFSGMHTLDYQIEQMLLDSHLRSRMEVLMATGFDSLDNGSEVVSVNGTDHTIDWSVANEDINGDGLVDDDAKRITVVLPENPEQSLTTIRIDPKDRVGKIS
jgi:prepilin-type N-terminal cleavage/methylation domain-containing protein